MTDETAKDIGLLVKASAELAVTLAVTFGLIPLAIIWALSVFGVVVPADWRHVVAIGVMLIAAKLVVRGSTAAKKS